MVKELRALVRAIRDGEALPSDGHFDALIEKAVQQQGPPADEEEWAKRLAEDVSDLCD